MHFASMSLGIFDFLINWLTQFIMWVVGWVFELLNLLFAHLLYSVACSFLEIVDVIQKVFRKLCGMDVYWVGTEKVEGIDPLLQMFTNESVVQVLIALSLVAVVMVIVASIIQVIRTEFSTEGSKNSKGAIFGQALKSLFMFFLVPICCIGGIGITNALLKTIDRATSLSGDNGSMGATILVSSISGSNVIRKNNSAGDLTKEDLEKVGITVDPSMINETNSAEYALQIDSAFRNNEVITSSFWGYQDITTIEKYYDILDINFIILIGGSLVAAYTMLMASFGMVMRLFKGAILFMISPPMVALMPLDNGSAFKDWRKNFLGQILAAYGTIVGLNLLFLILPVINNINLFSGEDFGGVNGAIANQHIANTYNGFTHVLFTLTGLFMLKDISSMISNMIGASDAAASGGQMAGKVAGAALQIGMVAATGGASLAGSAMGALSKATAGKGTGKLSKAFGGISNSLGGFAQKGKGIMGKAVNKGIGTLTGGAVKGPFSEEQDFVKAQEARDKKRKERKEKVENGQAGIGSIISEGISNTKFGKGWVGFKDNIASGGTSTSMKAGEVVEKRRANLEAAPKTTETVNKEIESITSGTTMYQKFNDIVANLTSATPDGLAANDQVSSMLAALNAIAEKTEEQKDLIQKLTTLQGQIASAAGDKTALNNIGTSGYISDMRSSASAVTQQAIKMDAVMGDSNFNIQAIMTQKDENAMNKVIQDQISAIAGSTGIGSNDVEKIVKKVVEAQKAQLEKMKEEKGGKK